MPFTVNISPEFHAASCRTPSNAFYGIGRTRWRFIVENYNSLQCRQFNTGNRLRLRVNIWLS